MKPERAIVTAEQSTVSESAERIVKIVQQLQRQITDQRAEFERLLKQEIELTERRVEQRVRLESEQIILERQAAVRQSVTEKLVHRFDVEIYQLHSEFDRRLERELKDAEAAADLRLRDTNQTLDRLTEQAAAWTIERERLVERLTDLESILESTNARNGQILQDYQEVERQLDEALQSKAQMECELQRAILELNSNPQSKIKNGMDSSITDGEVTAVESEIARVQLLANDIEEKLVAPYIDLAAEMRLHRERLELQAYIKGLRYSRAEVTPQAAHLEETCHA